MTETEIEKLTDQFLRALKADPGEMTNFLLWCFAERLKATYLADLPEGTKKQQAAVMVKVAVMETLRERGCDREEVKTALKVSEAWITARGWHKEVRDNAITHVMGYPWNPDLPDYEPDRYQTVT